MPRSVRNVLLHTPTQSHNRAMAAPRCNVCRICQERNNDASKFERQRISDRERSCSSRFSEHSPSRWMASQLLWHTRRHFRKNRRFFAPRVQYSVNRRPGEHPRSTATGHRSFAQNWTKPHDRGQVRYERHPRRSSRNAACIRVHGTALPDSTPRLLETFGVKDAERRRSAHF